MQHDYAAYFFPLKSPLSLYYVLFLPIIRTSLAYVLPYLGVSLHILKEQRNP